MRFSKLTIRILFSLFVLICSSSFAMAASSVQFSWAVLMDTATGLKPINFTTPPKLKSGAELQIYLEQQPGTFIYIYLLDSTGGLSFIFPGDPKYYNSISPRQNIIRIPPDTGRFELTPPQGQEKLYLLASPTKLANLEELTAAYLKDENNTVNRASVIRELKLLHRKYSSLAQKTETSVPVAGTVRTRGSASSNFNAVHVSTDSIYSRILRINHD